MAKARVEAELGRVITWVDFDKLYRFSKEIAMHPEHNAAVINIILNSED